MVKKVDSLRARLWHIEHSCKCYEGPSSRVYFFGSHLGERQNLTGWNWGRLESVRIGKCQKWLIFEIVRNYLDWKVLEWKLLRTVEIGKSQKLFRLESVRNFSDWKVAQIWKCQKLLRFESVRNCSNWKVSELEMVRTWVPPCNFRDWESKIGGFTCKYLGHWYPKLSLSNLSCFWHFPIWAIFDTFQSQQFLTLSHSDIFQSKQFLTLFKLGGLRQFSIFSNSDTSQFLNFPVSRNGVIFWAPEQKVKQWRLHKLIKNIFRVCRRTSAINKANNFAVKTNSGLSTYLSLVRIKKQNCVCSHNLIVFHSLEVSPK